MNENEVDYKALYEEAFAKEIEPGTSGYGIAYRDEDGKDLNGIPWLDGVYSTTEELNEGIQNLKETMLVWTLHHTKLMVNNQKL